MEADPGVAARLLTWLDPARPEVALLQREVFLPPAPRGLGEATSRKGARAGTEAADISKGGEFSVFLWLPEIL